MLNADSSYEALLCAWASVVFLTFKTTYNL